MRRGFDALRCRYLDPFDPFDAPPGEEGDADFRRNLLLVCKLLLAGLLAACVYHFVIQGVIRGRGYPRNTFLFRQDDRFNDYRNLVKISKSLDPYFGNTELRGNYLPLAHVAAYAMSRLPMEAGLYLYLLGCSAMVFVVVWLFLGRLKPPLDRAAAAAALAFGSYPFLFAFDRAHSELPLFVLVGLFFYFYAKERKQLATLFLSFAIAGKIYPAVFALLYCNRKNWRYLGLLLLYVLAETALGLALLRTPVSQNLAYIMSGFQSGLGELYPFFSNTPWLQSGVSVFHIVKVFLVKTKTLAGADMGLVKTLYKYFCVLYAAGISGYIALYERKLWRAAFLLTAVMLILPYMSADYKLLHLLVPLLLFLRAGERGRLREAYLAGFLLLLIPKQYSIIRHMGSDGGGDLTTAIVLDPLLMLLMSGAIVYEGVRRRSGEICQKT